MPLDWYVEDILNHPQITQMIAPRLGAARATKRATQEWEAPKEKGGGQQSQHTKAGTPGPNNARNVARKLKGKESKKKANAELNEYRSAAGKKGKDRAKARDQKAEKGTKVPRVVRARNQAVKTAWAFSCLPRWCTWGQQAEKLRMKAG